MTRKLSVVPPDAPVEAEKKAPTTVAGAADSTERDLLWALRSHLAREMDKGAVPAHAMASVSAKIREYDRDIRAMDAREEQESKRADEVADEAFDASAV
jgi:hypothetical protein